MLNYYYGTMTTGKSATLLMNVHQKELNGVDTAILKPNSYEVKSRVGLESECINFKKETDLYKLIKLINNIFEIKYYYIDECQFLTKEQIKQLWKATRDFKVDINCFGLKVTYKNTLFEGIKTLMIYADKIIELEPKTICKYCDEDATTHLLFIDNKPTIDYQDEFVNNVTDNGSKRIESVCIGCWEKYINNL